MAGRKGTTTWVVLSHLLHGNRGMFPLAPHCRWEGDSAGAQKRAEGSELSTLRVVGQGLDRKIPSLKGQDND